MTVSTKPKIAFFDFTGCEGCQLTVIDALQAEPAMLNAVEIAQFREATSRRDEDYQIAFVEGSCSTARDEKRLRAIRERAQIVVALGACAHLGGVNLLRNWRPSDEIHRYVYGQMARGASDYKVMPIGEVIRVDGVIPGCPICEKEFVNALKALLQHRLPKPVDYPICVECKLNENACLFQQGAICLGPVTRAGCGAICPSFGAGCQGCRGLISNPNLAWLGKAAAQGDRDERLDSISTLFLSQNIIAGEAGRNGKH